MSISRNLLISVVICSMSKAGTISLPDLLFSKLCVASLVIYISI